MGDIGKGTILFYFGFLGGGGGRGGFPFAGKFHVHVVVFVQRLVGSAS